MNPAKVLRVAMREYASTALTKWFIIGALVIPMVMFALIPVIGILAAGAKAPAEKGTLLVLDRSGEVADTLAERLSEEQLRERRAEIARRTAEFTSGMLGGLGKDAAKHTEAAIQQIEVPIFRVQELPADADIEAEKQRIREDLGAEHADPVDRLLGVIEIDSNAVLKGLPVPTPGNETAQTPDDADPASAETPSTDEDTDAAPDAADDAGTAAQTPEPRFGSYTAFFRPKLNQDAVGEVEGALDWSIRERRYQLDDKLTAAGVDRDYMVDLATVARGQTKEITEEGERDDSSAIATYIIPVAAMILILIATLTGGQYLLTTTIEEKSSRVVEVLLSAVSPMELMTGKILGQMAVGLSLLVIYNSLGIVALVTLSLNDLVNPMNLVYFFILFVLAYAMFASMMAAIGSAVNDLREAQSLVTPVMLFSMLPYFFFMPVIKSPNSVLSTVLSFVPPIGPFIMIMRVASTDPPPWWQVWACILVMACAALGLMWIAAKIFRVGLLMFGKPPNFATLIKWVRMA